MCVGGEREGGVGGGGESSSVLNNLYSCPHVGSLQDMCHHISGAIVTKMKLKNLVAEREKAPKKLISSYLVSVHVHCN